jgi:hypothetical protein
MSEYQYYEFQALDRTLTEREREELRSLSSRATITATRFTNHYEWGDFKGAPPYAAERARKEKEEREARERYLKNLAQREVQAWGEIDALIATKQPGRYDEAVKLHCDLRELGLYQGRADEVDARLRRLCEEHPRKPSFLDRLKRAGLV